jgi:hypothetical protein
MTCNTPPSPSCANTSTRRTWGTPGTCSAGTCTYTPSTSSCTFGCSAGACIADPCLTNNGGCDTNATCSTSATIVTCACRPGYVGNGQTCLPSVVSNLEAFIKASNTGAEDAFGTSVSLSADGNTLAVGAPEEDSSATGVGSTINDNTMQDSGAVYVYVRTGTTWTFQVYLKGLSAAEQYAGFGTAVALSANGNMLAVGAPSSYPTGAVHLYSRTGSTWTGFGTLRITNQSSAHFGQTVALNADGTIVAAGAPNYHYTGSDLLSGAVIVHTLNAGAWVYSGFIRPTTAIVGDRFGEALALSADGNTLVIGSPGEDSSHSGINGVADEAASDSGAAFVYRRNGVNWNQEAYVKATNTAVGDEFGSAVTLSTDGNTLAVGAPKQAGSGAAYLFARSGTVWANGVMVKASNPGALDVFGGTLALSGDGATLVVGAISEDSSGTGVGSTPNELKTTSGAAYVYTRAINAWTAAAFVKASNTDFGDSFSCAVALDATGSTFVFGAFAEDSNGTGVGSTPNDNVSNAGAVYVYR